MTMNAIVPIDEHAAIDRVKLLHNIVVALKDGVFVPNMDYGVIPGTGNKPTLLLPGMEKLMRALRLRPEYVLLTAQEDFDAPLFHYRYECRLVEIETGDCVSTAIGSANSRETKWRWREAKRVCPTCGKDAIIKGKAEYGGGYICFAKKGGCGAKFTDDDPSITGQIVGRIENEDIFDQVNTIDKIAQKRALGSAIKGAANVSEFFTVDLEDLPRSVVGGGGDVVEGEIVDDAWTRKEQEQFCLHWRGKSITDADQLKALGVTRLSEWTKSRASADQRVKAWLDEQMSQ